MLLSWDPYLKISSDVPGLEGAICQTSEFGLLKHGPGAGYSMLGMVARSLSMRRHSSVEIPRDRYRVTAMLSASVEISLVYQVTSPLAEDEMMPRSSRMKRSRVE